MKKFNFQTKASAKREKEKEAGFLYTTIRLGFCLTIADAISVLFKIYSPKEVGKDVIINGINELVALLICSILIGIIGYNMKRKHIFIKTNANLIKAIGGVVAISGCTPVLLHKILESPVAGSYNHYLFIVGYFIIAIGYIFQHAIKMKEEQDLTI